MMELTISRRSFGTGIVSGTAALAWPNAVFGQARETKTIDIASGTVRGAYSNGVASFWGIPFGADTAPSRFQPALPAASWVGVRDCFTPGNQAPQMMLGAVSAMSRPPDNPAARAVREIFGAALGNEIPESEDCLYLNVFTPDASRARKRPVLFWLHGGGFAQGTGGTANYDGSILAKTGDVVVVSINSRLNAMGYLYLGAFHEDFADSGNVGQLDQILALKWVQLNIEAFGGDPNNITIFGESGGGAKVSTLMAMPMAEDRFHKAIVQSGPVIRLVERDDAVELAERTMAKLGISTANVHEMQKIDYRKVIAAAASAQMPPLDSRSRNGLAPVVDRRSVPAHPFDPVAPSCSIDVPMIVGTNKDESTLFSALEPGFGSWTDEQARARYAKLLGDRGGEAYELFQAARPHYSPTHLVTALTTAERTWINSIEQAEKKAEQGGAPAYMYRLDWETPVGEGLLRSPHGIDVGLLFGGGNSVSLGDGDETARLSAAMVRAWTNFAYNGSPSQDGLLWPHYDTRHRNTMIFDLPSKVVSDPDLTLRKFFAG